jgi:HEPN domain-containing protein
MDICRARDYWVIESDEALKVAWDLFKAEDYSYSLFFGHLAVEKILKAIYVVRNGEQPPFIHDLIKLAENSDIKLDQNYRKNLTEITIFNLESRSSDEKRSFRKKCTKDFTKEWLIVIEEIFKWLKPML